MLIDQIQKSKDFVKPLFICAHLERLIRRLAKGHFQNITQFFTFDDLSDHIIDKSVLFGLRILAVHSTSSSSP